ncbi:hypothetical protein STEG23_037648 [Scotinomys teguina]
MDESDLLESLIFAIKQDYDSGMKRNELLMKRAMMDEFQGTIVTGKPDPESLTCDEGVKENGCKAEGRDTGRTSSTILNKYGESGQHCLLPDFSGITLNFSTFNLMGLMVYLNHLSGLNLTLHLFLLGDFASSCSRAFSFSLVDLSIVESGWNFPSSAFYRTGFEDKYCLNLVYHEIFCLLCLWYFFLEFFKGISHFLFKGLYHLLKIILIDGFCFFCVGITEKNA